MEFLAPMRHRLRSERGMALPVALFAMISSMALAGAAVIATVDVQRGSHRDNSSKSAIAAADAGANIARQRLARYAYVLDAETAPCLSVGSTGLLTASAAETVGGSSWCPPVSGTVGGATYSYRVTPVGSTCGEYSLCVVSTGTAAGVSRRIEVTFKSESSTGSSGSTGEKKAEEPGSTWSSGVGIDGLISDGKIQIDNGGDARVNIGTNGDVYVDNTGNVCGSIRHGVGKKVENKGTQCKGYAVTEGNVTMPPVSSFMPADIATNNSNYRLVKCTKTSPTKVPTGCQTDSYSVSNKKEPWTSTIPWNPTTRTISTENNATLTLSGGDYFICKLQLTNNAYLIMAAGAQVRIFFDTPEHCGLSAGAKQIDVSNNANISSTGYQPTLGQYSLPGFYLTGSTSIPTNIELSPNGGSNEFLIYAPNSEILIKNKATYIGIIAGKTVHLENAIIKQDAGFGIPTELNPWKPASTTSTGTENEPEPTAIYFDPQSYVECSGGSTTGLAPNANC
jgi:hypothetical protein